MTGPELRRHQAEALAALERRWAARTTRTWVTLPPGAGKTLVGLRTAAAMLAGGSVSRVVAFAPNTAIQGQWAAQGSALGLEVGTDRVLDEPVTALTYQSLAVFDADAEVDDDGLEGTLLARLHPGGRALVEELSACGPVLLVLDECHHLLEVWGRLLAELLDRLPQAVVLGLTATPPTALPADQAALVEELFGDCAYAASIPALVREGDLAPFSELVWLASPTAAESAWLAESAARFAELLTDLTDPEFGSTPFLSWLDARFTDPDVPWLSVLRTEPDLARAALRAHHAGMLALPPGARLAEEHRVDPTSDDWVLLVEDWLTRCVRASSDPADEEVVEAVRRALPSVGYVLTRRGIRRGRSVVDRVLARSESKTVAATAIVAHEQATLGDRLRMLVLCDHERASALLPADLDRVMDAQSGSAVAVVAGLVADAGTAGLDPMLVTGSTVAASATTLAAFREFVAARPRAAEADLAARLEVQPMPEAEGVARLVGPWSSRTWVRLVTDFFTAGGTRVLVGTRGLLGEGWDAPAVTGLVDLTAVTTTTAVTQTRGRALRVDPAWREKVAVNWTVVCVADDHPRGGNDWDRLVRKHAGYLALDQTGEVTDGVAHCDSRFSAFAPPDTADFDAINAEMVVRSQRRHLTAEAWAVGTPYVDAAVPAIRVLAEERSRLGSASTPAPVVAGPTELAVRDAALLGSSPWPALLLGAGGLSGAGALLAGHAALLGLGVVLLVVAWFVRRGQRRARGTRVLAAACVPPSVAQVACAVADALHAAGLSPAGSDAVRLRVEPGGEYRCVLEGVGEPEAETFAVAVDEVMSPLGTPRYVVPRWVVPPGPWPSRTALAAASGRAEATAETWHAVPTVLGVNAGRARAFARAWQHWVGGGEAVFTGSPEGAGVLAAQAGTDPFAVTTLMRRHWG
ncbi:DEAD/DEAH box helicase [Nocardioides sp. MAHUQ-72]|uniref:DEAD/DEAH box helicase n=1 Tax=unclassified Nocardioides TaxID=2615069 RepID=UPI003615C33B